MAFAALFFRSLWKVISLSRWVLDILCRTFCLFWSWSFPTACQRAEHRNTSKALGLNLIVVRLEKSLSGCLLHSGRFPAHVFPSNPAQTSATKKRSAAVGCNESTCSTTTRRLLQSDVVRSCIPLSRYSCRRRTDAVVQTIMWCAVVPGFQDGLYDLRISTKVFPHAPVVVGIVEVSAVNRPY